MELFQDIEAAYLLVVNNEYPPDKRRASANDIAKKIIRYVFNKADRKADMLAINSKQGAITKTNANKLPYKLHPYGKLDFLCDFEYIPLKLKPAIELILSRGFDEKSPEKLNSKPELSFLSIHEILNNILEWFLNEEHQNTSYLVAVHIIAENDIEFQKSKDELITSFWNVKKNKKRWIDKYATLLLYSVILFPLFIGLCVLIENYILYQYDIYFFEEVFYILDIETFGVSYLFLMTIISFIGIHNTHKYVLRKRIKVYRYLLFFIGLLPVIYGLFTLIFKTEIFFPNSENEQSTIFLDPDPNNNGMGFLAVSYNSCSQLTPECLRKRIDLDSISTNEKTFNLFMEFKWLGKAKPDSLAIHLDYNRSYDTDLRIGASSYYLRPHRIFDTVRIMGLKPDETLTYTSSGITYVDDGEIYPYDSISIKELFSKSKYYIKIPCSSKRSKSMTEKVVLNLRVKVVKKQKTSN
ncbi:hypothetical protein [uncultured Lacinutrix sp.]|uniref:hypothetical protein n=1 Tax=uncultured Lacinutrix sp. TaxID=574032 RepID=UPI002632382D|nr:hypothetical protein [uncultured Lacinutrix sp.]